MNTLAWDTGVQGPGPGAPASWALLTLLLLLLLPLSLDAWYKHVESPRYHTVGRTARPMLHRALCPIAGSLAWDTLGLDAPHRNCLPETPSPWSLPPGMLSCLLWFRNYGICDRGPAQDSPSVRPGAAAGYRFLDLSGVGKSLRRVLRCVNHLRGPSPCSKAVLSTASASGTPTPDPG